jgi:very-short-patch-repair endonuclease
MKWEDDVTKRRPGATRRARQLRRDETDAERRLWYRLSGRELGGYKFVRQIPLGPYVVDFLCRSERLVVEVDGEQHAEDKGDARRTAWLNDNGYSVLRFWNHEVLREREAVLDAILAVLTRQIRDASSGLRFAPTIGVGRGVSETRLPSDESSANSANGGAR